MSSSVEQNSKKIIARLLREGWEAVSSKGSHHKFRHTSSGKIVIVPHPKRNIAYGTARSIAKHVGWL